MTRSSRSTYKTSKSTPTKMDTPKKTTTETTPSSNHTSPYHLSKSRDKRILETQTEGYRFPDKKSKVFGRQNF